MSNSKCETIVFLKNRIPKIFQIFKFEKLDLKKNEIFTILKISKMESALKTESKTVFGARSIFQLFKSMSWTAVTVQGFSDL